MGRFLNADSYPSTGQGILGNNMFAYCYNNPSNFYDRNGKDAVALQWWMSTMGWLPFADAALPFGEIIFVSGILVFGALALSSNQDSVPQVSYDEVYAGYSPISPDGNDDNDDDDDDDYDESDYDDSNFGGRQRMGNSHGKAPRNNKAQNKQFNDATRGLNRTQKQKVHREISHKGNGFHDIRQIANEFLNK